VRNFPYILPKGTDGRKFPCILIGESRNFLPILLIGVIDRMFLNILPIQNPPKNLLEQIKDQIWLKHYSHRTENSYVQCIRRYILSHSQRSSTSGVRGQLMRNPTKDRRFTPTTSPRTSQPLIFHRQPTTAESWLIHSASLPFPPRSLHHPSAILETPNRHKLIAGPLTAFS
jgi:hypothetical protein